MSIIDTGTYISIAMADRLQGRCGCAGGCVALQWQTGCCNGRHVAIEAGGLCCNGGRAGGLRCNGGQAVAMAELLQWRWVGYVAMVDVLQWLAMAEGLLQRRTDCVATADGLRCNNGCDVARCRWA